MGLDLGGVRRDARSSLYSGSTARNLFAGAVTDYVFDIAPCNKQWCLGSGSVPELRLLRARLTGPRDDLPVLANDIATKLAEVIADLPLLALLWVFDALPVAAGLALNDAKTLAVNYGHQSDFMFKRRLLETTGAAQVGVARPGVYLGFPSARRRRTFSGMLHLRSLPVGALCFAPPMLLSGGELRPIDLVRRVSSCISQFASSAPQPPGLSRRRWPQ